jgi:hypothetical protein
MHNVKFNIFKGLNELGKKNLNWYNSLSDQDKKVASPFVMMRWLSGTNISKQIIQLNTFANPYIFNITDKNIIFKLLAISCVPYDFCGNPAKIVWLKGPSGISSKKISILCISEFYGCSKREAMMYNVKLIDLIQMAEALGWDKDQIKILKKECDDQTGSIKSKSDSS